MQLETATVLALNETDVTLSIRDVRVTLSKDAIAGTPKVGSEVRLIGVTVGAEDAGRTELAKTLLNELVGVQPPSHV